ncbi:hypothetical protein RUND412_002925 [Rhizina undulata]
MLEPLLSLLPLALSSYLLPTLNLLFFHITYTALVFSYSPLTIEICGSLVIRLLFLVLPISAYLLLDAFHSQRKYKSNVKAKSKSNAKPKSRVGKGRRGGGGGRVILWTIANVGLSLVVQAAVEAWCRRAGRPALRVGKWLPGVWELAKDVFLGMGMREVLYYYIHRFLLHGTLPLPITIPALNINYHHKTWQHAQKKPWVALCHYDHPAVDLLCKWLPVYLPAALLRFHVLTYFLFLSVVSLEEAVSHGGYKLKNVPGLNVFTGVRNGVHGHFKSGGQVNFSPYGIMDWIHGT